MNGIRRRVSFETSAGSEIIQGVTIALPYGFKISRALPLQRLQIQCKFQSLNKPGDVLSVSMRFLIAAVTLCAVLALSACGNSVAEKRTDSATREERIQIRTLPIKATELRR